MGTLLLKRDDLTADIDGSNVDFTTTAPYVVGSLNPIVNGLARTASDNDGVTEVDSSAGTFQTKEVLNIGDHLIIEYYDASQLNNGITGIIDGSSIVGVVK